MDRSDTCSSGCLRGSPRGPAPLSAAVAHSSACPRRLLWLPCSLGYVHELESASRLPVCFRGGGGGLTQEAIASDASHAPGDFAWGQRAKWSPGKRGEASRCRRCDENQRRGLEGRTPVTRGGDRCRASVRPGEPCCLAGGEGAAAGPTSWFRAARRKEPVLGGDAGFTVDSGGGQRTEGKSQLFTGAEQAASKDVRDSEEHLLQAGL